MFKTKTEAATLLAEKLHNDRVNKKPMEFIWFNSQGKVIADILKHELSVKTEQRKISKQTTKTTILVDTGSVSVSELLGKIHQLREENVRKILIAMPVYKHEDARILEEHADAVYILNQPKVFLSAEEFYQK